MSGEDYGVTGKFLFYGYGYTAEALAPRLAAEGWSLAASARDAARAAELEAAGVEPLLLVNGAFAPDALSNIDAVLVSAPPDETGCPGFRALAEKLGPRGEILRWIGYLSTNGVYGDHGGEWVDETSLLRPSSPRAKRRIAAEADWAAFGVEWAAPVVIFRLPGIYGPGRSALDTVRAGRAQRIVKPGQVFSRAHVDDIAAALLASINNPRAGDLFNVADDEPAPPQDVIEYACRLLGVEPPPEIAFEDAQLSEMAKSFYTDNKRVSNKRMKDALEVALRYPTYREGLTAILAAERGPAGA